MPALVALDLPAGTAFVEALRRAWDAGDAVLPLDQRLAAPARAAVVAAMRPSVVVGAGGERTKIGGGEPVEPGDAVVVATSGTTGQPKGVVLTHEAVVASALATSARLDVDPGRDRWLACLPLAHVGGLAVVVRAIVTGTPIELVDRPDASLIADAAARGCTLTSLVPTLLRRIDPAPFRRILLGGSAPPGELPPNVTTTYGMTETGSGIAYDGLPLDGVDIDLRPASGGAAAEPGAREVAVRGPMLLRCYRDGSDPKDAAGWLATGDAGRIDAAGRLVIEGRLRDLIITGGENVWPDAVDAVLREVAGVADAAVVGVPDDEWGERVVAAVVPSDPSAPPSLAALRDAVRAAIAAHAAPKELVLVQGIPRTASGKVRRPALQQGVRAARRG